MPDCLFVYGTLHPDRAPAEVRATVRTFKPLGRGSVRGTLYNLGDYPGLLLPGPAPRQIGGDIFLLPTDTETLGRLDDYERYHPANPVGSLFCRVETLVTLTDGSPLRCWVYVYNHPIPPHLQPIL